MAALTAPAAGSDCIGDCNGDGRVSIDEVVRGVGIALGTAAAAVCGVMDGNLDGLVTIDELVTAVDAALNGCPPHQLGFVVATDFVTGAFATLSIDDPSVIDPTAPARQVHSDAVPRVFGRLVYVVNRFFGDNVQALDPAAGFATRWQCSTGNGSNPQDIAVLDASKAYVTRYGRPELWTVNPVPQPDCSDFERGSIDLSALADEDGIPEMDQMAIVDGRLYVSLQRLTNFAPLVPGMIAVIDTATDTLLDAIELAAGNPFSATKGLTVHGGALLVGLAGALGVEDGGIERIEIPSGLSHGFLITEEELGGDLNDFVIVSDRLGYAIVATPDFTTALVAFDPQAGVRTATIVQGVQFLADIELNDRGEIYALDRTFDRPGVRIFRASDGVELTTAPLNVGLTPFQVVFLR